jgi:hypothetical protein
VAQLLILTSAGDNDVLPALGLLSHKTRQIPAEPASLITAPTCDLILIDARYDLASSKSLCKILNTTGVTVPLILILTEGGLTAVSADWGVDDVILEGAGPAEADARIRLALGRQAQDKSSNKIQASGVVIDEASYSAKVHGKPLDLTFKEFELLRFLATAVERGVGIRLLRRHSHRRRAREAPARQTGRPRVAHRNGAQRRLPVQCLRRRERAVPRSARELTSRSPGLSK